MEAVEVGHGAIVAVHARILARMQVVRIKDGLESDDSQEEDRDHDSSMEQFQLSFALVAEHAIHQEAIAVEVDHPQSH